MVYIASFLLLLNRSLENIATTYNVEPAVAQTLQHSISTATYSVIFFSGFLLITVFALGLILSHRVFGPMVPIMRVLEALKNGDYSARANLRSKDEFNDVMEAVNDLAAQLESKYGNSSSANSHAQS
jgi:signal transduction histidine kinase